MIADSIPWKEELWRVARNLERRKTQARWTARSGFLVERDTMTAAYAIRKLIEAHKLSDEVRAEQIPAQRHVLIGDPVDFWSRDKFIEHYDMENPENVTLSLINLCNQIIHSLIWMRSMDGESMRFDGIFVCSDRARKQHVYFIHVDSLIETFRSVANDDIVTLQMQRDAQGDMHVIKASRSHDEMPPSWGLLPD
ncbi:hypothetical protein [Streptomyces sp. SID13031]|uniref:hypothetical protein n=1 Tax=Streptomyces sp. SID13031 TaxID=2706046 RepID=UPI0013C7B6DE|nr:hypothetical protein [Streptomyces sp. SID13031]NEA34842.1 hypothetical protein [Streptomyces sp. SID13031]